MSYVLREAESDDARRLGRIFREARTGIFRSPPAETDDVKEFRRQADGELVLVATNMDGQVFGWMSVWLPESFVHHLYVDPTFQRCGVGRFLLDALPGRVPVPYTLKCVRSNRGAMAFYDRLGWTEIGSGDSEDGAYALLQWHPAENRV
jgi:ribosomal protein S18 acetylase RimI-like enzyme